VRQPAHNPKLGKKGEASPNSAVPKDSLSPGRNPTFLDGSKVNQTIVDRVAAFVERFVFLKNKPMYTLVALWIIHTHLHQSFQYTGYLFIHSPEKQCGKTCLLETLDLLCRTRLESIRRRLPRSSLEWRGEILSY